MYNGFIYLEHYWRKQKGQWKVWV